MRWASRMMAPVAAAGLLCAVSTAAGAVTTAAGAVHPAPAHAAAPAPVHAGTISGTGVVPGGTRLWVQRFTDSTVSADRDGTGTSVAVSPDRSIVYVTGLTQRIAPKAGQHEATTVAYNALNGSTLWVANYLGSPFSPDGQQSVVVSPDGAKVFVVSELGQQRLVVLAYNALTGAVLWTGLPSSYGVFEATDPVAVSPNSTALFVGGTARGRGASPSHVVYAFDTENGTLYWSASTTLKHPLQHPATSVVVSPDGSTVYESGSAGVVAYNAASGSVLWTVHYKIRWQETDDYLAVSPDSSTAYVTNASYLGSADGPPHIVTTAYNAGTGAQVWSTQYHGPDAATPSGIVVNPAGTQLFVTGDSFDSRNDNTETIGYNADTGAQVWAARSASGWSPSAIALSPDGTQVFVTGSKITGDGGQTAYGTEAYDTATGTQLWAAELAGSTYTRSAAIAVSPDGSRVFVTGGSSTVSGSSYYLTVAYHT